MATHLSRDESRAVAFIGLLLALSAGARLIDRPEPVRIDAPGVDLAALEAESRRRHEQASLPALGPGERIDPNTAPPEQLERLPGAGRTVVDRIVAERSVAPFRTVQDLDRVRGVGPATIEKWAPFLTLPARTETRPARAEPAQRPTREPIDLNTAGADALERLPGIGPALAARIVAYRDSVGRFGDIGELERVRGIGPAMMAKIAPLVRIRS